ncbi:four helix bundle protein [bacterium]|nr:four helix bundle protein [bacterium]
MPSFDHEKLSVYQASIEFVAFADELLSDVPKSVAICNQLDRAACSVPLNIAEGNGKFTPKDRCRFFDIARGSALECAACLDVLAAKGLIGDGQQTNGKDKLVRVVQMLVGLIRANSDEREF